MTRYHVHDGRSRLTRLLDHIAPWAALAALLAAFLWALVRALDAYPW